MQTTRRARCAGVIAAAACALAGCGGTALMEVQSSYAANPSPGDLRHASSVSAHAGGSDLTGFGLGLTGRLRGFTGGWALPEVGPHAFVMSDRAGAVVGYGRITALTGVASLDGEVAPTFGASVSPGVILYPGDAPMGVSVSLHAEVNAIPDPDGDLFTRGWVGLNLGLAIGGAFD